MEHLANSAVVFIAVAAAYTLGRMAGQRAADRFIAALRETKPLNSATVGREVIAAIREYERQNGTNWRKDGSS